jgi:chromosome segregation ATPase
MARCKADREQLEQVTHANKEIQEWGDDLQRRLEGSDTAQRETTSRLRDVQAKLSECEATSPQMKERARALEAKVKHLEGFEKKAEEYQQTIWTLLHQHDPFIKECERQKAEITNLKAKAVAYDQAVRMISETRKEANALDEKLRTRTAELATARLEVDDARARLDESTAARLEAAERRVVEAAAALASKQVEVDDATEARNKCTSELALTKAQLSQTKSELEAAKQALLDVNTQQKDGAEALNELRVQVAAFLAEHTEMSTKLEECNENHQRDLLTIESERNANEELNARLAECEVKLGELELKAEEQWTKRTAELEHLHREEKETLQRELEGIRVNCTDDEAARELAEKTKHLKRLQDELEAVRTESEQKEAWIAQTTAALAENQTQLEAASAGKRDLEALVEQNAAQKDTAIAELETKVQELRETVTTLEQGLEEASKTTRDDAQLDNFRREIAQLKAQLEECANMSEQQVLRMKELEETSNVKDAQIKKLETDLQQVDVDAAEALTENAESNARQFLELRNKLRDAERERDKLQEEQMELSDLVGQADMDSLIDCVRRCNGPEESENVQRLIQLEAANEQLKDGIVKNEAMLKGLQSSIGDTERELVKAKAQAQNMMQQRDRCHGQLDAVRNAKQQLQLRVTDTETLCTLIETEGAAKTKCNELVEGLQKVFEDMKLPRKLPQPPSAQ